MSQKEIYGECFTYQIENGAQPAFIITGDKLYLKFTQPSSRRNNGLEFFFWTDERLNKIYKENPNLRRFFDIMKPCYGVIWAGGQNSPEIYNQRIPDDIALDLDYINKTFSDIAKTKKLSYATNKNIVVCFMS